MRMMNFIAAAAIVFPLFVGCKDVESKATTVNIETTASKSKTATTAKPETASFKIDGMTCSIGCAKTIEAKLAKMEGVLKATVDFDKKQATVEFDSAVLTTEKLVKAVETTGDGETYKVSNLKTNSKV